MSSSRPISFTKSYQNSVMVMEPSEECLEFEEGFYDQWGKLLDKLLFNYAVKLYDPLSEMFEIYVDTDESLRMVLFGFSRIFSAEGIEMDYNINLANASNTQVPVVVADFEKVLSNYDVKASSLYLDSKFVKECLMKGRKTYTLTNGQSQFWNCKIRWTGRSSYECYLTCGWKKFCKENGLAAGDRIRFVVENEEKCVIHILKNYLVLVF
ncbi:hypothetical protein DEO72_LG1g2501 [Vigna unguiculata]|uniref:TF-B3 domain-containing protein n=1 Tax=Vigna unguiculata TaxID=3917 RepID=A0A4D6KQJ5_VIGUN|nr:hypothetical protein DEO72_LG1g2501 [Vigna unguiculata]